MYVIYTINSRENVPSIFSFFEIGNIGVTGDVVAVVPNRFFTAVGTTSDVVGVAAVVADPSHDVSSNTCTATNKLPLPSDCRLSTLPRTNIEVEVVSSTPLSFLLLSLFVRVAPIIGYTTAAMILPVLRQTIRTKDGVRWISKKKGKVM